MRKVFLEDLPHKYGFGANKDKLNIDWVNSIGSMVAFEYDNITGEIKITSYVSKGQKVKFLYNGIEYERNTGTLVNCNLRDIVTSRHTGYKYKIGDIINGRTVVEQIKIKQKANKKGYVVRCNIDGYESMVNEYNLIHEQGCPVCAGQVVIDGVNSVYDTHPWVDEYVVNKEILHKIGKGHKNKILMRCPDCGEEKLYSITDLLRYHRISCVCRDGVSYPNKIMFNLLKELDIKFIPEYSPKWIGKKRYDFYIPSRKLIIEMDGSLGHGYKVHSRAKITNKESVELDNFKSEQAILHGLKIIRIDCKYEGYDRLLYIKNSIENSGVFACEDLNNIDWVELDKISTKNMIKQICDDWESNEYKYLKDLAIKYNVNSNTIRQYLKKGNDFGWCSYNKDEILTNGRKSLSQKVGVFKDGVLLREFNTKRSLRNQSKKIFGVCFDSLKIKLCCSGEIDSVNGYQIKDID